MLAAGLVFSYWSMASYIENQIDARLRLETKMLLNLYQDKAMPALAEAIRQRSQRNGQPNIFFYRLLGRIIDGSPAPLQRPEQARVYATLQLRDIFPLSQLQHSSDTPVRVLVTKLPQGQKLIVGRDLNNEQQLLDHTLHVMLGVIGVTFFLVILGSILLGYKTLRRIDAVSHTAGEIMAGDLSQRIPLTDRDDEFDLLGRKLNAMLERIEQLLAGMRQVTDNIAHDLRSPLNRLRNRLDITLLEARNKDEYRTVLEQTTVDIDELLRIFNALLNIAQAEAGIRRDEWKTLDLAALAEELAELYGAVAEERGVQWLNDFVPNTHVWGNRQLLAQAISNLLDNAVKYTPSGGRIELRVNDPDGQPMLSVIDTGPGIPAEERERVLERFVRLDSARSQSGSGLGLSLVKAVAKLHKAELVIADNHPGLRVSLQFAR